MRAAGERGLPGTVLARSYLGEHVEYLVQTAHGKLKGSAPASAPAWVEGAAVSVGLDVAAAAVIPPAARA